MALPMAPRANYVENYAHMMGQALKTLPVCFQFLPDFQDIDYESSSGYLDSRAPELTLLAPHSRHGHKTLGDRQGFFFWGGGGKWFNSFREARAAISHRTLGYIHFPLQTTALCN